MMTHLVKFSMARNTICLFIYLSVCLSVCLSVDESINQSINRSIYLSSCCSHLEHRASVERFVSLQFLNVRQSVGLLARRISPSHGPCLHTGQHKHRINAHGHSASNGSRTHDPGEDSSCLRLRGHCDRALLIQVVVNFTCPCFSGII
jgi:hypothetical protein